MSKGAISGIVMIVIGGVILLFQQLGSLMGDGKDYEALCLVDLVDPGAFDWIDSMTFLSINKLLDTIVMAPLYILLFCVGAVFLIVSGFKKN